MGNLSMTNFEFALKEMYPEDVLRDMVYKNNPLLAMLPKDEEADGELQKCPIIYGNPQGRSAALATAITNKGNTAGVAFLLTLASDYSVASIRRQVILASQRRPAAFVEAAEVEVGGAMNTASRSLAKAIYGSGSGSLGVVGSISTVSLTLSNINDVTNFEVNMELESDTVDGGGTVNSGTATITAINEDTGVLTSDSNWTGQIASLAANDYLFQQGDYDSMLKGLAAWVPASAPTSTAFFGIDRTVHASRLGGLRITGTGMPVEQALLKAAARLARGGAHPNCAFINDVQYYQLITSLGSKVEFVKQGVSAEVFFSGVIIHGPRGPIEVYPDYNCDSEVGYVLQLDTWTLYSLKAAPHIFDEGTGQEMLREATVDGYEIRTGYYAQLGCKAPGWNARVSFDAATF